MSDLADVAHIAFNIIWSWIGIIFPVRKWFSLEALLHMPTLE